MNRRQLELAWAAGFFDGEGSVSVHTNRGITLSIAQVQLQPLRRFQTAIGGIGNIRWDNRIHRMALSNGKALGVIRLLYPFLSQPKRTQAINAIGRVAFQWAKKPHATSRQEKCLRGHSMSTAYVAPDGARECRICRDMRRVGRIPPVQARLFSPRWLDWREYDSATKSEVTWRMEEHEYQPVAES